MGIKDKLPTSSPVFEKIFAAKAKKLYKKLVRVSPGNLAQGFFPLREKDFTLGLGDENLEHCVLPLDAVGQVVGYNELSPGVCRVLIGLEVFHINAALLKEILPKI